MRSFDRRSGEMPRGRQTGPSSEPGRGPQETEFSANAMRLSQKQVLQLQRSVGNRAAGTVIQRMIDASNGDRFPVNWGSLNPWSIQILIQKIRLGQFILEEGEWYQLKERIRQLQSGGNGTSEEKHKAGENEEGEPEFGPDSDIEDELEVEGEDEGTDEAEAEFGEDHMTLGDLYHMDVSQMDADNSDFKPGVNPIVQELYDTVEPKFKQVVENKGRKVAGKKAQGDFLEQYVTTHARDMDTAERDANQFYMNIPGIDHMLDNSSHPFVQDKMHLSAHTAKIETYRAHYTNRFKMAKNLLTAMVEEGKRGTSIRSMFESVVSDNTWLHKNVVQSVLSAVNRYRSAYQKALNDDKATSLPDIGEDDGLIQQVGNQIAFAVPSDIWEQLHQASERGIIDRTEMRAYIRLDLDTADFRQLFDLLSHVASPWNERKPKEEDDEYRG